MDPALMTDDQRREHFHHVAQTYARRYAGLVISALGGHVSADAAAVLHRIGFELGHDACQVLANEIRARTQLRPDASENLAAGDSATDEPAGPDR